MKIQIETKEQQEHQKNKNCPKIVFQDVDGCLNPDNGEEFCPGTIGELSLNQKEMLQRIVQAVEDSPIEQWVLNTGRGYVDSEYIMNELRTSKFRYAILEHSAIAWDHYKKEEIPLSDWASHSGLFNEARRFQGVDKIKKVMEWYLLDGQKEMERIFSSEMKAYDKQANLSIAVPQGYSQPEVLEVLETLIKENFPEYRGDLIYCWTPKYVDVTACIDKADGARIFCEYWDIPMQDVAAIGDSLNDVPLFREVGQLVCPSQSIKEILSLCEERQGYVSPYAYGLATLNYFQSLS